jgi:hypothetical protein
MYLNSFQKKNKLLTQYYNNSNRDEAENGTLCVLDME